MFTPKQVSFLCKLSAALVAGVGGFCVVVSAIVETLRLLDLHSPDEGILSGLLHPLILLAGVFLLALILYALGLLLEQIPPKE